MLSEKKLQYQGRTTIIAVGGAKSIKWDMNPPITCYFIMALLVLFQLRVGVNIHQWVLCIVLTDQSWSWKQIIQAGDVIKIYHVLKLLPAQTSGVPPPWNCLIMTTRQATNLYSKIHSPYYLDIVSFLLILHFLLPPPRKNLNHPQKDNVHVSVLQVLITWPVVWGVTWGGPPLGIPISYICI